MDFARLATANRACWAAFGLLQLKFHFLHCAGTSHNGAVDESILAHRRAGATALGMVTNADPRLRTVDFGAGEGMTATEMAKAFPEELARFRSQPATCPLPGGESGTAAADRAWRGLDDIRESETDTVLVVMHSTLVC